MSSKKLRGSGVEKFLPFEQQQVKIEEVRKLIGPLADKFPTLFSDASILRYLRARNWNTKKASKMLKETLKWRMEYKPETIRWEDIVREAETGKVYITDYCDKYGRTVLIMRPGSQITSSIEGQIRHLVYCMEKAIMDLKSDQEQMVWLIDFQGWNMSSISVKVTRETAHILQNRYPERLGLAILYNPPKIFESFWLAPILVSEPMPVTRSGTSYAMANNPNPTNPIPNNQNTDQPQLQHQIDQIGIVLEQLIHRLDVMDEHYVREEYGPFNRRGRGAVCGGGLDESDGDADEGWEEEENQEFEDHGPRIRRQRRNFHRGHAHHGAAYQPLDELTKRMKVDVPDFYGKLEPNAFEDWLTAIEDYFDWFAVSEDRKVRYVRMTLKGHARAWWGSVEEQLRRTRRPVVSNWEDMKERLKEKYLPIDYEQMMFEEMLQLRQGSLSVDQFTDRFHELTVRSKIVETEQQTLARYRTGLRSELRREMWTARLINVEEAYQLALRIEKQMGLSVGRKMMSTDSRLERVTTPSFQRPPVLKDQSRGVVSGDQKGKAKGTSEGPQCYKCKGFGHYAVVCPTRDKKLAFICEKELLVVDVVEDTNGEETDGSNHGEEEHLASANAKRKDRQFTEGDMVLVRLRPERFPPGSFTKLHARRAGPFRVTKKLGTNAYVIDLPSDFGISPVFNIEDLTEFKGDVDEFSAIPSPEVTPALRVPENTAPRDEIAAILDHQFVTTRRGGYYKFLVQWKNRPNSESVWLQASEVKRLHPHLFAAYIRQNLPQSSSSGEPAIDANQEKDTP
ncbi:hypothetical protein F0562_016590 [Nyssa sinensis]|uniref:CCHC-type domain-containing protein n=1 Tax=Nyssa sinensis TaxID=561372 RepID=A0A5J4ZGD4_9ASTE|nr:hypothetical protein F0562_016590 [Nyssa sinensis]